MKVKRGSTLTKQERVKRLLKADPNRSDRAISKAAGCDGKTVARIRAELESGKQIPHISKAVDATGRRRQPKRKPRKRRSESAPAPIVAPIVAPIEIVAAPAVDPKQILEEIATDAKQPAGPRVAAAKALLTLTPKLPGEEPATDALSARAIEMMNRSRRLN